MYQLANFTRSEEEEFLQANLRAKICNGRDTRKVVFNKAMTSCYNHLSDTLVKTSSLYLDMMAFHIINPPSKYYL